MTEKNQSQIYVVSLSIIATAFAAGAFILSWQPSNHFFNFSPQRDGYVSPRDISRTIDRTQKSTVTVYCNITKDEGTQGTAWAINSELLQSSSEGTALMTNFHVIDECLGGKGNVTIAELYEDEKPASIMFFDKQNDLAILETDLELKPLELSRNFLWSGYWVMTLGSAAGYEGSVSFGNIVNTTNEDVLITNNISEGNSGGPLIDNEGKVVGIVTWGSEDKSQQFNGAKTLDVFCEKVIRCEFETGGKATWYNYEE